MRDLPLEPPPSREEKLGLSDEDIHEMVIEDMFDDYPPRERLDEYLVVYHPSERERKAFFITRLMWLLPEAGNWIREGDPKIAEIFNTWREIKASKAGWEDFSGKEERIKGYPTCYGIVEWFWDEIIEPTRAKDEDEWNENSPYVLMFNAVCDDFDNSDPQFEDYCEFCFKHLGASFEAYAEAVMDRYEESREEQRNEERYEQIQEMEREAFA